MKKTKSQPRRTRVNMRFPTELLVWAKDYAEAKHTSVTQILVNYLAELRERQ